MSSPTPLVDTKPQDMFALAGKTALITGAGSGLGAYFAKVLAEQGVGLVLAARRMDRLEAVAQSLPTRSMCFGLDLRKPAQFAALYDKAEAADMPIDILVNNGGGNYGSLALQITQDDYDATMDTNTRGSYFMAQEMARRAIETKRPGRIINIASIGAHTVLPGLSVYCMSKAALLMMGKAMAREWANAGINVNTLCPGYIATDLNADWFASAAGQKHQKGFARRRLAQMHDLRDGLLAFASFASQGVTGASLTIDDGQSL